MTPTASQQAGPTSLIFWMAGNKVAATLLLVLIVVGGLFVAKQTTQEIYPPPTSSSVVVDVSYPGASPDEVERGILLAIEDSVRGLDGVAGVGSTAYEALGSATIDLHSSVDTERAFQDIKAAIDRITTFPRDAERPLVSLVQSRQPLMSLLVYGTQEYGNLRQVAEQLQDELKNIPGVESAQLGFAPIYEISVEISSAQLRSLGLSLEDVANAIRNSTIELPAGEIRAREGRILLRTRERRDFAKDFDSVPITTSSDGATVTLGSIARIQDGFEESDVEMRYNGQRALPIDIFQGKGSTPAKISAAVHNLFQKFAAELPSNIQFSVKSDTTSQFNERLNFLLRYGFLSLLVISILLSLTLDAHIAFWTMHSIPVAIIGAFLFAPILGFSINMHSLVAFLVTLGIVIDNAVVTSESIYRRHEEKLDLLPAAQSGAIEVATPLFFAVCVNLAGFLPLLFDTGIIGAYSKQIPLIAISVLAISLTHSLFVVPSLISHNSQGFSPSPLLVRTRDYVRNILNNLLVRRYVPLLHHIIRLRLVILASACSLLIISIGLILGDHLQFVLFPRQQINSVVAQAELPFGTPLPESRKIRNSLANAAADISHEDSNYVIESDFSQIGAALIALNSGVSNTLGSHLVAHQITLASADEHSIDTDAFARTWRNKIADNPLIRSLSVRSAGDIFQADGLEINLSHASPALLEAAARELKRVLSAYEGVREVTDGIPQGKRQYDFNISQHARSLGVTTQELGRQIRSSVYGVEALRQQRGRNEVRVFVRLPETERNNLHAFDQQIIRTPDGGELPLWQAAVVNEGSSYLIIQRYDGQRILKVFASVNADQHTLQRVSDSISGTEIPKLQEKYPGLAIWYGGEPAMGGTTFGALFTASGIALLVIYTLLAIAFQDYIQPLIVMVSIPFAVVGAVCGHLLFGYPLSVLSLFGIVALFGVVVNSSMVVVSTANELRKRGFSALAAIRQAEITRFRAVFLTTLIQFFGIAPMILDTHPAAQELKPIAISIGFGTIFSALITFAVIPALYLVFEGFRGKKAPRT